MRGSSKSSWRMHIMKKLCIAFTFILHLSKSVLQFRSSMSFLKKVPPVLFIVDSPVDRTGQV